MKKFIIQYVSLIAVIAVALLLFKTNPVIPNLPFLPERVVFKKLQINGVNLKVEVADTQAKRSKGLSGRQTLASDEGMLFVFPKPDKYQFWMKGLTFPLDFVWIRGEKVVDLLENIPPPASEQTESLPIYQSKQDADQVLEINAGMIRNLNIKVGDIVQEKI